MREWGGRTTSVTEGAKVMAARVSRQHRQSCSVCLSALGLARYCSRMLRTRRTNTGSATCETCRHRPQDMSHHRTKVAPTLHSWLEFPGPTTCINGMPDWHLPDTAAG